LKGSTGQQDRTSVVSLETHSTPIRNLRQKLQINQPGGAADLADLGAGKPLLEGRAKAVAGDCA